MTKQAEEFLDELDDPDWERYTTACTIVATTLEIGRPPAGRWQRIKDSKEGLSELRITKSGTPGPQLRALCIREGDEILIVRGILKKQSKISRRDIDLADRAVRKYRSSA